MIMSKSIKSYDIDGVINLDEYGIGIRPGSDNDIIITGRSIEESEETYKFLEEHNISNIVYLNPIPFDEKTRESSGWHKVNILNSLTNQGINIIIHYEDDEIQANIIRENTNVKVIKVDHQDMIELENVRR